MTKTEIDKKLEKVEYDFEQAWDFLLEDLCDRLEFQILQFKNNWNMSKDNGKIDYQKYMNELIEIEQEVKTHTEGVIEALHNLGFKIDPV